MTGAAAAVLGRHVNPRRHRPRPTGRDCAVHQVEPGPLSNKLLAALPRKDFELLLPHLTTSRFEQATMLCEAGTEFDHVYFPLSGMISLVVVMRDGKAIETATVGREGVVGAMSGLGLHVSQVRAIAQLPMFAARIASAQFRKAVSSSKDDRQPLPRLQRDSSHAGAGHRRLQRAASCRGTVLPVAAANA